MCGGFTCSKNTLIGLNIVYVIVGFVLIGAGVYARAASIVTNLPIVGGILACGIILILVSILGLVGAVKHHQVILFFYMIVLFLLFLIQFSIASSCLAVNTEQQKEIAEEGWNRLPDTTRRHVQNTFLCCGYNQTNNLTENSCEAINHKCCLDYSYRDSICQCEPCLYALEKKINYAFKLCGGLGIFFSFTEVLAVFLVRRYRNQQNPNYLAPRAVLPPNYQY